MHWILRINKCKHCTLFASAYFQMNGTHKRPLFQPPGLCAVPSRGPAVALPPGCTQRPNKTSRRISRSKWAPRAPSAPPLCHLHSGLCHQGGPAGARRSTLNCAHGVFTHPASSDRHLPASDRELLTCLLGVWACSSSSAPRGAGPLLPGHCPAALPGGSWVWRPGSVRAPFSTLVKLPRVRLRLPGKAGPLDTG